MRRTRTTIFASALFALTLALAACSSDAGASSPPAGGGGTETVSMANTTFTPSSLTIQAGTTVTFIDTSGHTVTQGTDGVADDNPIVDEQGGEDIEVTFDEPGTYNITCKVHPEMNMTITVEG